MSDSTEYNGDEALREAVRANHLLMIEKTREANELEERYDAMVADRDRLQRLFNRLDAAITHHKRDAERYDVPEIHDESLWAARDRILRDSAKT